MRISSYEWMRLRGHVKLSISTAKTIYDLRGDALDANASFGPVGLDLMLEELFVVACEALFGA
jgi:hypothetical protein